MPSPQLWSMRNNACLGPGALPPEGSLGYAPGGSLYSVITPQQMKLHKVASHLYIWLVSMGLHYCCFKAGVLDHLQHLALRQG